MNQRTIDATLAVGAGLIGALLLVAAALRLFAPIAPIVVAAPMLRSTEARPVALRLALRPAPLVVARPRAIERPRRALGVKTHARTFKQRSRKLQNAHVQRIAVVKVHRPRSERPHARNRPRLRTLPEAPIGYDPQPTLAGVEMEALATLQSPDVFPSVVPQRRRRR